MGASLGKEQELRIAVLGTRCCGLSCFHQRCQHDPASYASIYQEPLPTIGGDFSEQHVCIQLDEGATAKLFVFTSNYWQKMDVLDGRVAVVVLLYDITCTESFTEIQGAVEYVRRLAPQAKMMVVGNKMDLCGRAGCDRRGYCHAADDCRQTNPGAVEAFAASHGIPRVEVSSLDATNIGQAVMMMCTEVRLEIPAGSLGSAARREARLAWEECVRVRLQSEAAERISFHGTVTDDPKTRCIVSYPGAYGGGWNNLVHQSASGKFSTACVFLPDGDPLNGVHEPNLDESTTDCYCIRLYGKAQPWGCAWFKKWKENVERAQAIGQPLWVIYFLGQVGEGDKLCWDDLAAKGYDSLRDNVGLGASQKGEVAWLKRRGYVFHKRDVMLSDSS